VEPEPISSHAAPPKPVDDPRVYLAAERTLLAWVRTSVALMGFGFLISRFAFWLREYETVEGLSPRRAASTRPHVSPWFGFGMVVVGVFVLVMSAYRHREYIRALQAGDPNPPLGLRTSMTVAAILALVGLAMSIQIILY
jgi:putative membrane protein